MESDREHPKSESQLSQKQLMHVGKNENSRGKKYITGMLFEVHMHVQITKICLTQIGQ